MKLYISMKHLSDRLLVGVFNSRDEAVRFIYSNYAGNIRVFDDCVTSGEFVFTFE